VHIDFQRVEENEKIRISIPLHFKGAAVSPGVKSQGGIVSHMRNEVEVSCLPKDLPEFIEVDISGLSLNESIHLSQLKIPEGVHLVDLGEGRCGGRGDSQPACGRARAHCGSGGGAPAAEGAAAAACGGGSGGGRGDAAKKAEPAKKDEEEGTGKERRQEIIFEALLSEGRQCGGPYFFEAWVVHPRWLVYRCASSSVWAIRDPNIR
jgi:large subunit ribosomal protein L25